jgi:hypothetical protein
VPGSCGLRAGLAMGNAPRRAQGPQDAEARVLRTPRRGGVPPRHPPSGPGLESSSAASTVNIVALAGMPGVRWGTHGRDLLVRSSTRGSHDCPCRHPCQPGGDGGRGLRRAHARGLAPERGADAAAQGTPARSGLWCCCRTTPPRSTRSGGPAGVARGAWRCGQTRSRGPVAPARQASVHRAAG